MKSRPVTTSSSLSASPLRHTLIRRPESLEGTGSLGSEITLPPSTEPSHTTKKPPALIGADPPSKQPATPTSPLLDAASALGVIAGDFNPSKPAFVPGGEKIAKQFREAANLRSTWKDYLSTAAQADAKAAYDADKTMPEWKSSTVGDPRRNSESPGPRNAARSVAKPEGHQSPRSETVHRSRQKPRGHGQGVCVGAR